MKKPCDPLSSARYCNFVRQFQVSSTFLSLMHSMPIEDYSFHALLIPMHLVKLVVRYNNWVLMIVLQCLNPHCIWSSRRKLTIFRLWTYFYLTTVMVISWEIFFARTCLSSSINLLAFLYGSCDPQVVIRLHPIVVVGSILCTKVKAALNVLHNGKAVVREICLSISTTQLWGMLRNAYQEHLFSCEAVFSCSDKHILKCYCCAVFWKTISYTGTC
jgi:hypothetical protein